MVQTTEHSGEQKQVGEAGHDPIEAMAAFDGPATTFLPQLIQAVCQATRSPGAAVFATAANGQAAPIACYPPQPQSHPDSGAWLGRVKQSLETQPPTEACRIPLHNNTGQQVWAQIVLAPIRTPGSAESRAMLGLFVNSGDAAAGYNAIRQLERAAQVVARYELSQTLREREGDLLSLTHAMQALDAVNREARIRPAAIALCNQMADTWQATRVSVGFLAGQTVKLKAMSHTEDITRKMQLVQDLEAAMEECIDQDSEVLTPSPEGATTINRQARLYTEKHGPVRMSLLPLRLRDKVVGALAVEWPTDHAIAPVEVESLRVAANLFTARLHQFHLDDRWLGARHGDISCARAPRSWSGPSTPGPSCSPSLYSLSWPSPSWSRATTRSMRLSPCRRSTARSSPRPSPARC